jgi:hypothetical protein
VEARRSIVVVLLDVEKHEVMLQKMCLLWETSIGQGAWTATEEESFIPRVRVSTWRRLKGEDGWLLYQIPLHYHVQLGASHYGVPKEMVCILDVKMPPGGVGDRSRGRN